VLCKETVPHLIPTSSLLHISFAIKAPRKDPTLRKKIGMRLQQLRHGGIPPSPRNLAQILPRGAATPRSARLSSASARGGPPGGAAPKLPKVGSAGSLASASSPPALASLGSSEGNQDDVSSPQAADLVAGSYTAAAAVGRADRGQKPSAAPAISPMKLPLPVRRGKGAAAPAAGSGDKTAEKATAGRTRLQRRRPTALNISDSDRSGVSTFCTISKFCSCSLIVGSPALEVLLVSAVR